jgi:hypothetical protein
MKVLIRDKSNGRYVAEPDEWVRPLAEARDFGGAVAAVAYAAAHFLRNIELVHAFPDARYNFSLALN